MGAHMTVLARIAALLVLGTACGLAGASPNGATLVYRGGGDGKVVFDGRVHAAKGYVCNDCHTAFGPGRTQLFATHKSGLIDKPMHKQASACFACHDGKTAFKDCDSCHREVTGY